MSVPDVTIRLVEQRLFELAAALRFVAVEAGTRRLHLRALELKRLVRSWEAEAPAAKDADAVVAEIEALGREARRAREAARRWRPIRFPVVATRAAAPS